MDAAWIGLIGVAVGALSSFAGGMFLEFWREKKADERGERHRKMADLDRFQISLKEYADIAYEVIKLRDIGSIVPASTEQQRIRAGMQMAICASRLPGLGFLKLVDEMNTHYATAADTDDDELRRQHLAEAVSLFSTLNTRVAKVIHGAPLTDP